MPKPCVVLAWRMVCSVIFASALPARPPWRLCSIAVSYTHLDVYKRQTLEGVAIQEREGAEIFAGFDSLYLNLESSSLFRGGPVLSEIRLAKPKLRVCLLYTSRCV